MPSYTITSPYDQAKFARFLHKVGGYDEVMRLDRELKAIRRAGHRAKLVRDPVSKKYSVQIATD